MPETGIPSIAAAILQRWAVTLMAYSYTPKFKSSTENADAYCLSRLSLPNNESPEESADERFYVLRFETMPLHCRHIARETARDPVLKNVMYRVLAGWHSRVRDDELKPFFQRRCEFSVHQGCLIRGVRVTVPAQFQK